MNTSVEKTTKKRKSLAGKIGTPVKVAKLNESVKSPKADIRLAKSPKKTDGGKDKKQSKDGKIVGNKKPSKALSAKSPKKFEVGKKIKKEEGEKPKLTKLQKFQRYIKKGGVKKPKTAKKKCRRADKPKSNLDRKNFLLEKLRERAASQGKESVIKEITQKIDAIISKPERTKTSKKTVRIYKQLLNTISGEEIEVTASATNIKKVNKKNAPVKVQKAAEKIETKKVNKAKKSKALVLKVEPEEDDESDEENITSEEAEESSDDAEEEENSDDDEDVEEESDDENDDEDEDEESSDEEE